MPARGPHDEFDLAKKLIVAGYANFNLNQDIEELREKYLSDELEYVTRQGTFHGPDQLLSEFAVQSEKWILESEIDEIVDAGEGAVIVMTKMKRIDRESGEVVWKAWPAIVMRVHGGKMVFNEGYIDRRRALAAFGVEQG